MIKYNGTKVLHIKYNGADCDIMDYNGITVFSKPESLTVEKRNRTPNRIFHGDSTKYWLKVTLTYTDGTSRELGDNEYSVNSEMLLISSAVVSSNFNVHVQATIDGVSFAENITLTVDAKPLQLSATNLRYGIINQNVNTTITAATLTYNNSYEASLTQAQISLITASPRTIVANEASYSISYTTYGVTVTTTITFIGGVLHTGIGVHQAFNNWNDITINLGEYDYVYEVIVENGTEHFKYSDDDEETTSDLSDMALPRDTYGQPYVYWRVDSNSNNLSLIGRKYSDSSIEYDYSYIDTVQIFSAPTA